MKALYFILILLFTNNSYAGEMLNLSLSKGMSEAISFSRKLEAKKADYFAALAKAKVLQADNQINIFADAQYKRLNKIPSMTLPAPINRNVELGQKDNYSAGINVQYLLTDFGQTAKNIKSAEEESQAQEAQRELTQAEIHLGVKQVFHKLVFQISQLHSLYDAWELAEAQEKDMGRRFHSGMSSRLDQLKASKETLSLKLKFLQMQREFASTLQDWFMLTGEKSENLFLEHPLPDDLALRGKMKASLLVKIDTMDTENEQKFELNSQHPASKQLEHLRFAQDLKAEANFRSYFPRIQIGARSSREYPLGGKDESYTQHALYLNLTMPLWDGGKRSGQDESLKQTQKSYLLSKENLENEFQNNFSRLNNALLQLKDEIVVAKDGGKEAEALAKLTYQSYLNGHSNFLEVQSANLKVLEWKTQTDSLHYAYALARAQIEFYGVEK